MIETAITADSTIRQKYETHKEGMTLLSQGPESLAASLPNVTAASTATSSPAVMKLRELMEEVETIKVSVSCVLALDYHRIIVLQDQSVLSGR